MAELWGADGDDGGPGIQPCLIQSHVFLCGESLEFVNGEFVRSDFEMGGEMANYYAVGGRWPGDVWRIEPGGTKYRDLQRLDSRYKWQSVAHLPPERWDPAGVEVRAWLPGRALVVDYHPDMKYVKAFADKITIRSPGPRRRLPSLMKNGHRLLERFGAVEAFPSGGVVMAGTAKADKVLRVLTWKPGSSLPSVHDLAVPDFIVRTMVAPSLDDVTIVGDGPERARGFRGKNGSWTEFELPRWGDSMRSYAREPGGKGWIVLHRHNQTSPGRTGLSVWSREPQSEWHRVELPLPKVAEGTFDYIWKNWMPDGKVWAPSDDNVWILVRSCDKCAHVTNFVFHNARPKNICQMESWDSSSCKPTTADRVRTTRCPNR